MGPIEAITSCLRKSFRFSGRTSRSEIWWIALFLTAAFYLVFQGARLVHSLTLGGLEITLLCFLVPYTSALARRMHDLGRPGYLAVLLVLSPLLLGILAMILSGDGFVGVGFMMIGYYTWPVLMAVIMSWPSKPGPNRYGPNPLEVTP